MRYSPDPTVAVLLEVGQGSVAELGNRRQDAGGTQSFRSSPNRSWWKWRRTRWWMMKMMPPYIHSGTLVLFLENPTLDSTRVHLISNRHPHSLILILILDIYLMEPGSSAHCTWVLSQSSNVHSGWERCGKDCMIFWNILESVSFHWKLSLQIHSLQLWVILPLFC